MGAASMSLCHEEAFSSPEQASPFAEENMLRRINRYWSRRADAFRRIRREEVHGDKLPLWSREILPHIPEKSAGARLKVLDVGTGAGFFAVLMATQAGCDVIGIDLCPDMLREAEGLARECGCDASFRLMDATSLDFYDETFDCLLVRNLTWTLLEPEDAYAEWLRVLKPGGVLLNFDADYGAVDFTEIAQLNGSHAHADMEKSLLWEGEDIRQRLPLSSVRRPEWDIATLKRLGFSSVTFDNTISERIYRVKDASYNPVPMFALRATK